MAIRREGFISHNAYAPGVGKTIYANGQHAPNVGPVSAAGQQGYDERDRRLKVRRNALLAFMQGQQAGQYASPGYQRKA